MFGGGGVTNCYNNEQIIPCCREGQGTNWKVTRDVGAQMMNAFVAYDEGHFENCVALMKPLKYDILNIGGSNAQVVHLSPFTCTKWFNIILL